MEAKSKDATIAVYDHEQDMLALYLPAHRSHGSVDLGDIIVDLDAKMNVVGIEFLRASEQLSALLNERITKDVLKTVSKASLHAQQVGNNIYIHTLIIAKDKRQLEATIPVPIPSRQKPVLIV
ncbi:DUF2283 domain-containing protein [Candidatus Woesearchaeota archaeon]|nr:DUF2283 domain-containing protein [Candidatus Woesearchaeota archaeon]